MSNVNSLLRNLPQVDEVLNQKKILDLSNDYPHSIIVSCIRDALNEIRNDILSEKSTYLPDTTIIVDTVISKLKIKSKPSLQKVINATGVTLHTNFGRSILSKSAIDYILDVSTNYSNLEYDVKNGTRSQRIIHIEKLICDITGAEACMVVNNNAAATMLTLSAVAKGKEVVVSRGELIEIGGSFRIPEVMEQSGAILKEVGTTNKTKLSDYKNAYNEDTVAAFLKVHTSNYRVLGFTEEVSLTEMVELGKTMNVPVIYDLGSGLFVDLSEIGIDEPTIPDIINTGVDLIMFSGDKLLGGPQAGIIVGKKEYIDKMKKNPLARILRVDKLTIAALYATLYEYYDVKKAKKNIPTLHMITKTKNELRLVAENLVDALKTKLKNIEVDIEECLDQVGGGSAPLVKLNGYAVTLSSKLPAEKFERLLRKQETPIVARINDDKILIDVRCLNDEDINYIISVLSKIDTEEV